MICWDKKTISSDVQEDEWDWEPLLVFELKR